MKTNQKSYCSIYTRDDGGLDKNGVVEMVRMLDSGPSLNIELMEFADELI